MNYFDMYKDVWDFHKKYSDVNSSNEYWQNVIEESDRIVNKYSECKFIVALMLAVIDELRRVYADRTV